MPEIVLPTVVPTTPAKKEKPQQLSTSKSGYAHSVNMTNEFWCRIDTSAVESAPLLKIFQEIFQNF